MRLLRLKVTDFRGVVERELVFPDHGVLLLAGDNEAGKSTMFVALDLLFGRLSDSGHGDVRASVPLDRDATPEAEVELMVGDRHLVFRKRWTKRKDGLTELRELAPQPRTWTGREAHVEALSAVEQGLDFALWRALCVRQAVFDEEALTLSGHQALAQALDAVAGMVAEDPGEDSSGLLALVAEEAGRHHTARTGKETGELAAARQADTGARAALAPAEERSAAMSHEVARLDALRARLPGLVAAVASTRSAAGDLAAETRRIEALEQAAGQQSTRARAAQALAKAAADALATRTAQATGLREREVEVEARQVQWDALAAKAEGAATGLAAAQATLAQARDVLQRATTAATEAQAAREHLRDLQEHAALDSRLQALEASQEALAQARAEVQAQPVDAARLERLRTAVTDHRIAQEALRAAGARVRVQAERDLTLTVDGQPYTVGPGQGADHAVATALHLEVPGVLRLEVTPGAGLDGLRAQVQATHAQVAACSQQLGVADLDAAVAGHSARTLAEAAVFRHVSRIQDHLGVDTEAGLREAHRVVTARARSGSVQADLPQDLAAADAAVARLQQALAEARTAVGSSEAAEQALRGLSESAHTAATEARVRHEQDLGERDRVHAALAAAREVAPDAALAAVDQELCHAAGEVAVLATAATEALRQADPETAALLSENAAQARDDAQRRLDDAERQAGELRAVLAARGEDGVAEALDRARTVATRAEDTLARVSRRADAARLLHETLDGARREAHAAHARPLAERIQALGRVIWGPDWSVSVAAESLAITERVLDGVAVPYAQLSVGAREQLGILTRLAAAQLIRGQGTVPLILDDALGHSDPARLQALSAVLAQAAQDLQIVVLTSNPQRWAHLGGATTVTFD